MFARNESDVLVESYGSTKTDNVPMQYYNRLLKDETFAQTFFQIYSVAF